MSAAKNSLGYPSCTKRKIVPKKQIEFIGAKTKRQLMREGLSTRVRELKARLDQFEERNREQHQRHYETEIRVMSPEELSALDTPGSVFRLR